MRISDWSSDVCSSDLLDQAARGVASEQGALWTSLHLDTAHVIEFRQGGNGRGHVDIVRIQRDRGFIRKAEIVQLYATDCHAGNDGRSEEHTSELQSLMRRSYAVFCLKKKKHT